MCLKVWQSRVQRYTRCTIQRHSGRPYLFATRWWRLVIIRVLLHSSNVRRRSVLWRGEGDHPHRGTNPSWSLKVLFGLENQRRRRNASSTSHQPREPRSHQNARNRPVRNLTQGDQKHHRSRCTKYEPLTASDGHPRYDSHAWSLRPNCDRRKVLTSTTEGRWLHNHRTSQVDPPRLRDGSTLESRIIGNLLRLPNRRSNHPRRMEPQVKRVGTRAQSFEVWTI